MSDTVQIGVPQDLCGRTPALPVRQSTGAGRAHAVRVQPDRTSSAGAGDEVAALTAAIARGDESAFDRFHAVWFDRVHRYLLVIGGGWSEAVRDALQDTMLRAARKMKPFPAPEDLWNWLRRVARNSLYDQLRKRARWDAKALPLSALPSEPADASSDEDDVDGATAELKGSLAACLDTLSRPERELVDGKYIEAKSCRTLAGDLGISPKAVESRLRRIRKKLKTELLKRLKR